LGIVLPDADLDVAAEQCTLGATSYNGQRCTAIKLIMVCIPTQPRVARAEACCLPKPPPLPGPLLQPPPLNHSNLSTCTSVALVMTLLMVLVMTSVAGLMTSVAASDDLRGWADDLRGCL
jgi:hypothetical protein